MESGLDYKKIKELIDKTGLTQIQFAKKAGVSISTLRRAVYQEKDCGLDKLVYIANALNCELYQLFKKTSKNKNKA